MKKVRLSAADRDNIVEDVLAGLCAHIHTDRPAPDLASAPMGQQLPPPQGVQDPYFVVNIRSQALTIASQVHSTPEKIVEAAARFLEFLQRGA